MPPTITPVQRIVTHLAAANGSNINMDNVMLSVPVQPAHGNGYSVCVLFSGNLRRATLGLSVLFLVNSVLYYGATVLSGV